MNVKDIVHLSRAQVPARNGREPEGSAAAPERVLCSCLLSAAVGGTSTLGETNCAFFATRRKVRFYFFA